MAYRDDMQEIVRQYREADNSWPASAREIAAWAIAQGLWQPSPRDIVNRCAEDISHAMRDEYFIDPQGRHVRAKHARVLREEGVQLVLWDDIRTASHEHMRAAFQQRRRQIVGDCVQLSNDVESYNENRRPSVPIQVVFDFELDIEERRLAVA